MSLFVQNPIEKLLELIDTYTHTHTQNNITIMHSLTTYIIE
jgi:hypothetical protein